ncbi:MAG: DUF3644 domain-containing protein [Candidatus Lustribacter sp.]|jgi:hypothetical protein
MGKVRAKHFLQRAKDEALFACDLYNARGREPYLDAFIVHMQIAWTNLLLAISERDDRAGADEPPDLTQLAARYFTGDADPIARNLLFFIGLRERVELRFSARVRRSLGQFVAGRAQSLIANFERVLVKEFGQANSLANDLRFPLYLAAFSPEAGEAMKTVRSHVPKSILRYISGYDEALPTQTRDDQAYEFRALLVPVKSPQTDADAAITFVDERTLTDEQRAVLDKVTVIVRDRLTEVVGAERFRVGQVVALVRERVPAFTIAHHTDAWRYFKVRPKGGDPYPERTELRYCVYDVAFKAYTYTQAWVDRLIAELTTNDPQEVLARWQAASKLLAS